MLADWLKSGFGMVMSPFAFKSILLVVVFTHQASGALISPTKMLDVMMPVMNKTLTALETGG